MDKDTVWKKYFSDNRRYADIINGIGCKGKQLIKAADLCDADTRAGKKKVREEEKNLSAGEYLYGFKKDSRLKPVITFILYSGTEDWDGSCSLHEMIDFTDIPEYLKEMTPDYKINVIEIRKLENTECFKTDVRQVFDFIRCSEDDVALSALVKNDSYYQSMEEDAFDLAVSYTNATELIKMKDYYRKDGKVNMCTAITKLIADGREEGRSQGMEQGIKQERRNIVINMLKRNMSDEDICALVECEPEFVKQVRQKLAENF